MRKFIPLATLLALAACATPADRAASTVAGYTAAAAAVDAYARTPGADHGIVAAAKVCDNTAYAAVEPVKVAMIAKTPMDAASIAGAEAAVPTLQACLTALGVMK